MKSKLCELVTGMLFVYIQNNKRLPILFMHLPQRRKKRDSDAYYTYYDFSLLHIDYCDKASAPTALRAYVQYDQPVFNKDHVLK